MPFVALQGWSLQSATIGYAITPNPVRPCFNSHIYTNYFYFMSNTTLFRTC